MRCLTLRERVKVEEHLRAVIRDARTKEVVREIELTPSVPIWKKILSKLLGKECHATILDWGYKNIAALLGNFGTPYYINQMGAAVGGSTIWTSSLDISIGWSSGGSTLYINNSMDPWTVAGSYTHILTRHSDVPGSFHNSIGVTISISSGQEWWAEIEFRFT